MPRTSFLLVPLRWSSELERCMELERGDLIEWDEVGEGMAAAGTMGSRGEEEAPTATDEEVVVAGAMAPLMREAAVPRGAALTLI